MGAGEGQDSGNSSVMFGMLQHGYCTGTLKGITRNEINVNEYKF